MLVAMATAIGRRPAAVAGQVGDDGGERGQDRLAGGEADLLGPGAAGRRDGRAQDARVVLGLGEDVGLVAPERLGRVHRGVGVADEGVRAEALALAAGDADRDAHARCCLPSMS